MSVKLIAENILNAGDFSSATEQEGGYIGQPVPDSGNTGSFRLLSSGDIADFTYSGTTTSDGAGGGTTVIDSVLSAYGDDYFIGGTVTITSGACNGETKTVSDFAQSTGTLTTAAFSAQIVTGVTFTLTVAFATRDFRVILVDAGDAGDATFKWSHDGGTTYFGRDDPNQATWLAKTAAISSIHDPSGAKDFLITNTAAGTILLFYLDDTDSQKLKCSRSTDNGVSWGTGIEILNYEPNSIFWPVSLSSGRILLYHTTTDSSAYRMSYSDDDGLSWGIGYCGISSPDYPTHMIELANEDLILTHGSNPVYVRKSSDGGKTWGSSVQVNATANSGCVVQASNGNIICAYQTDEDSAGDNEIKCKISSDGGATWGSAINVMQFDNPAGGDEYVWPNVIRDINERIYCFAEKYDDSDISYTYSDDNGETWNSTAAAIVASHAGDVYTQPRAIVSNHSTIIVAYSNTTDSTIEIVRRGIWETYSANACPCAIETYEQKLICDVSITWHGAGGKTSNPDQWSFEAGFNYTMTNLIEDSPFKPWRSEQDNIACNIVIDLGTNERFWANGVGLFGCNIRTCSFQMNAADSWGSPSVDESISFDVATGTVDSVSGNVIQDTSLLANYKDHALKGMYLRMTSGTDSGVTWQILDNAGDYIFLNTTAANNISASDTFAIFQSGIAKTFTGGLYRFMRLAISAQHTADDYYRIGTMVAGRAVTLSKAFSIGYSKNHAYDIEMLRTPHAGLIPIRGADRRRLFSLNFEGVDDTQEEIAALIDYVEGKNIVLIPDDSVMTDCYLVKHMGDLQQRHRVRTYFDVAVNFEEIL